MKNTLKIGFITLISGVLFGFGLLVSGMADAANVLAFLTFNAQWSPLLALVMVSALLVTIPAFAWARRRKHPILKPTFANIATAIDARLLWGATIFGIGWGVSGYCPGSALLLFSQGQGTAVLFVCAMCVGALCVPKAS